MFKKIYKNKDYTSFLEGYFMIFNPLKHIFGFKVSFRWVYFPSHPTNSHGKQLKPRISACSLRDTVDIVLDL